MKSEGANIIVVKMTFPENENIQGLRAFSPTQPADLEKFNAVHEALDPNARIEQVSAVNLDELPELRRDVRRVLNPPVADVTSPTNDVTVSKQDVIDFSKDLIGSHVQYTEPPTRPPRPTKPVHPSSLPPTSTTPVPIDKAIFPLEYFTQSDVKREDKNVFEKQKVSAPTQYSLPSIPPPPPPPPRQNQASVPLYHPPPPPPPALPLQPAPQPTHAIPKKSYATSKAATPPPRPKAFRPPIYSNILTPESGYTLSGPNPGYY